MYDKQRLMLMILLFWGCLFSLVAALNMMLGKAYVNKRGRSMLEMQLCTGLMLFADGLDWHFRGSLKSYSHFMEWSSNLVVFMTTIMLCQFYHQFVCCNLFDSTEAVDSDKEYSGAIRRVKSVPLLVVIGMGLIILSQFNGMYYYFDQWNIYHRGRFYLLSALLPLTCMIIDFSLIMQYRRKLRKRLIVALCTYPLFPIVAMLIQILAGGSSLLSLSISMSMLLMYFTFNILQRKEMEELLQKQATTTAKLEIASTLNQCVAELSDPKDMDQSIQNLLSIVNEYYQAEQIYVYEADPEGKLLHHTYSFVSETSGRNASALIDISIDSVPFFTNGYAEPKLFCVDSTLRERIPSAYEKLISYQAKSIILVPLINEQKCLGFFGITNPSKHEDDTTLLSSLQYFFISSLQRRNTQKHLQQLSYFDALTGLHNRNKYLEIMEKLPNKQPRKTGIAFLDLNGLKVANDLFGHEKGDNLLQQTGEILKNLFGDNAYRIGGDEFVIMMFGIENSAFIDYMSALKKETADNKISISLGYVWSDGTDTLDEMLSKADKLMYLEKEKHHQKNPR